MSLESPNKQQTTNTHMFNRLFSRNKKKSCGEKNSPHDSDISISAPVVVPTQQTHQNENKTQYDFGTLAVHYDRNVEPLCSDVAPPLHFSTTYDLAPNLRSEHVYGRVHNATRERVEAVLGRLEGSEQFGAVTYASGQTATFSLLYHLRPKKVYINKDEGYWGTQEVIHSFQKFIKSYSDRAVRESFAHYQTLSDSAEQEEQQGETKQEATQEQTGEQQGAITSNKNDQQPKRMVTMQNVSEGIDILELSSLLETEMAQEELSQNCEEQASRRVPYAGIVIWLETPRNPRCLLEDIERYTKIAHRIGAMVVVDSTFASPVLQQPLLLGADYVVHSCTKFIGGHSDLLAAVVVARNESMGYRLRSERSTFGQNMGSMESWLLLRSLKTLEVRVLRQSASATELALWFESQINNDETKKRVTKVWYPLQSSHPEDYAICQKQMGGRGPGILSIELDTQQHAQNLPSKLKFVINATSLGAVESLIDYRHQWDSHESPTLLRISVGLESSRDLINDFKQAILALQ